VALIESVANELVVDDVIRTSKIRGVSQLSSDNISAQRLTSTHNLFFIAVIDYTNSNL
jgi:hypothetical protein